MSQPIKYSHQREAILQFLKTRTDHPTADMVYHNIKQSIPSISLGTVYRNLNQLADSGIILRLPCDGKTDHFDAFTHPHCHLMCRICGAVKDVPFNPTDTLIQTASALSDDCIETASVLFYGICATCETEKM